MRPGCSRNGVSHWKCVSAVPSPGYVKCMNLTRGEPVTCWPVSRPPKPLSLCHLQNGTYPHAAHGVAASGPRQPLLDDTCTCDSPVQARRGARPGAWVATWPRGAGGGGRGSGGAGWDLSLPGPLLAPQQAPRPPRLGLGLGPALPWAWAWGWPPPRLVTGGAASRGCQVDIIQDGPAPTPWGPGAARIHGRKVPPTTGPDLTMLYPRTYP